jgi:hypothetical protein
MLLQEGNAREHDNVAVHPGLTPAKGVAVISLVAPSHLPRTHPPLGKLCLPPCCVQ